MVEPVAPSGMGLGEVGRRHDQSTQASDGLGGRVRDQCARRFGGPGGRIDHLGPLHRHVWLLRDRRWRPPVRRQLHLRGREPRTRFDVGASAADARLLLIQDEGPVAFQSAPRPSNGGAYSTIYTSSYQTAKANDAIPARAGNGFSRRAWNAPDPNPTGRFKIWIEMQWLSNGVVKGFVREEVDNYKQLKGGSTSYDTEYCTAVW